MAADPRHIVGRMVEVKACHVMNLAECSRRYGSMTEFRQPLQVESNLEMPGILVQLGHIQRT